jgi:hypothetical protein
MATIQPIFLKTIAQINPNCVASGSLVFLINAELTQFILASHWPGLFYANNINYYLCSDTVCSKLSPQMKYFIYTIVNNLDSGTDEIQSLRDFASINNVKQVSGHSELIVSIQNVKNDEIKIGNYVLNTDSHGAVYVKDKIYDDFGDINFIFYTSLGETLYSPKYDPHTTSSILKLEFLGG